MRSSAAVGALGAITFGLAGLAWTVIELVPVTLGFEDTDSPAVSLAYLRDHPDNYVQQGVGLFVMALALTIVVFTMWDVLAGRTSSLGLRTTTAIGLVAAACFFLFGVLRYSVEPMLYIDSLRPEWGEAAYLVGQMAGIHGFAQGALITVCGWAVGVSVMGYRARALPRWLALLAVVPAIRLVSLLGPTGTLDFLPGELLWIVLMLSIPGTLMWFVLLGAVLLRRATRARIEVAST